MCGKIEINYHINSNYNLYVMLTPTTLTMAQQSTATVTIDTTVLSGVAQQITFCVVDPPKGIKYYFSPTTVNVGDTATLVILADKINIGTYPINIQATSRVTNHTAVLTLVVTASDFSI